jgi:hypothetical protein
MAIFNSYVSLPESSFHNFGWIRVQQIHCVQLLQTCAELRMYKYSIRPWDAKTRLPPDDVFESNSLREVPRDEKNERILMRVLECVEFLKNMIPQKNCIY